MALGISILGSGSSGNSIVIHDGHDAIMIDIGFSKADILRRLAKLQIDIGMLKGIILSHEHTDHCKGTRVFADAFELPVFASSATAKGLHLKKLVPRKLNIFEIGADFLLAGFHVKTFMVPHDVEETAGFIICRGNISIAIATDLGYMTALCEQRMKNCSAVILESNHDVKMQLNSKRNPNLIRRVLGRNGHLSNEAAAEALKKIISPKTKNVFLVHLSRECNDYEIVKKTAIQTLADIEREDILLQIATEEPLPTVYI